MEAAKSGLKQAFSVFFRTHRGYFPITGAVYHLKAHLRIRLRLPRPVVYGHFLPCGFGIAAYMVQHMTHIIAGQHLGGIFLHALFLHGKQPFRMHQHGSGGRPQKPSPVWNLLRLACAHKIPFPVAPCLHPCVIVIAVGPKGYIYLSGRNAQTAEHRYQKGGLLPAAPICAVVYAHGAGRALIRCPVCSLRGAPIVNLQHSLPHIHSGNSVL